MWTAVCSRQSAFGGLAKLQWKVDWAARWVALGVDYEMAGKDLIDSVTQSGKIARILGPRGLMPNPKTGTVTMDVTKAAADIKGGKITFRVDKHSNLHLIIGKASFSEDQLVDNYAAVLDEILRAKPSAAKGKYLKKVTFTTTMGPGVPVDPNVVKNLRGDNADA